MNISNNAIHSLLRALNGPSRETPTEDQGQTDRPQNDNTPHDAQTPNELSSHSDSTTNPSTSPSASANNLQFRIITNELNTQRSQSIFRNVDTLTADTANRLSSITAINYQRPGAATIALQRDLSDGNGNILLPRQPDNQRQNVELILGTPDGVDDIIAQLLESLNESTPAADQRNPIDIEPFGALSTFTLTADNIANLEDNSRVYLITDNVRTTLAQALERGDVGDHLVQADGWVFDYRELSEYTQHVGLSYATPPGVINHPMTRAPIDLRSEASRQAPSILANGPQVYQRPQRIERFELARLLNIGDNQQLEDGNGQDAFSTPSDQTQTGTRQPIDAPASLTRSTSDCSIATVDEMDASHQIPSYIKRYDANSSARQRRTETHLHAAFERELAGIPTVLTEGVRTRNGGRACALDVAAHYGRVALAEDMLDLSDRYNLPLASTRGLPEAAILALAEQNAGHYDGQGRRIIQELD